MLMSYAGMVLNRALVECETFALGADGNRVPALPPQEAANQAGGSAGLASSVETAAAYAVMHIKLPNDAIFVSASQIRRFWRGGRAAE